MVAQATATATPTWFTDALDQEPTTASTVSGGLRIAHRTWGAGTRATLILVHGGGAHSRWWDHIAPLLAMDRRVVALDLSGHGDSGRRERYSIDSWSEDLETLVLEAGHRPIVVGHSLGGMVTLRLAQRIGLHLGGIALLDSIIGAPTSDPDDRASFVAVGPTRRYESKAAAVARFRPVPFQACDPWILEHVAATSVTEYVDGWSWKFDSHVFDTEIFSVMPTAPIECRTAYLRAEHGLVTGAAAADIGRALGHSTVVDIPAAGHHLMLDQPLGLIAALRVLLAAWDD